MHNQLIRFAFQQVFIFLFLFSRSLQSAITISASTHYSITHESMRFGGGKTEIVFYCKKSITGSVLDYYERENCVFLHTLQKMLGCSNPNLGQIWTNPKIGLKMY